MFRTKPCSELNLIIKCEYSSSFYRIAFGWESLDEQCEQRLSRWNRIFLDVLFDLESLLRTFATAVVFVSMATKTSCDEKILVCFFSPMQILSLHLYFPALPILPLAYISPHLCFPPPILSPAYPFPRLSFPPPILSSRLYFSLAYTFLSMSKLTFVSDFEYLSFYK